MSSLVATFAWLERLDWTTALRESPFGYPLIETSHVACIVVFAGLVIMMDLRLVGLAFTHAPLAQIQRRLFPWQMASFVPSTATGILLFCVDPLRYYRNVLFLAKLVFLALAGLNALAFHLKTYRRAEGWDDDLQVIATARLTGAASLLLWSLTIVSSRLIPNNWFK
ncbi:MAG TPA: hypothetical protein VN654_08120 [Vicinamibacterales bacterium]|jgi:hypothetical protein|nr:hypothetical protein [Vicinamibacterales bacterium]